MRLRTSSAEMRTTGDVEKDARVTVWYRDEDGRLTAHRVVVNARYSSTLKKSDQTEQILHDIVEGVAVPV